MEEETKLTIPSRLKYAEMTARRLMTRHGLVKWSFGFDENSGRYGQCLYRERKIVLCAEHILFMKRADIIDIILHEVAHALTPMKAPSHGAAWKANAVRLGAKYPIKYLGHAPWEAKCRRCKTTFRQLRPPSLDGNHYRGQGRDDICFGKCDWRNVETGERITARELEIRCEKALQRAQSPEGQLKSAKIRLRAAEKWGETEYVKQLTKEIKQLQASVRRPKA